MFMAGLSPSMRQTLLKHVYTLYIHVYVIWSGFQMLYRLVPNSKILYLLVPVHTNLPDLVQVYRIPDGSA